jgi:hypothetical protein
MLNDIDLRKNKYSLDELYENAEHLSISTLLTWQRLNVKFCKDIILNEVYQTVEEKYKVDIHYVLKRQPHLKYADFGY